MRIATVKSGRIERSKSSHVLDTRTRFQSSILRRARGTFEVLSAALV
jgi:hypothetical protein